MDDETKADLKMSDGFLESLRLAGQFGELMAWGTARRLEQFKNNSGVQDQHERTRADVLEWLKETDDPNWWIQASERDVLQVFSVSSTWRMTLMLPQQPTSASARQSSKGTGLMR
ncbi:hypothetical protein M1D88_18090 [Arthrobacter sp. R1-13]